MAVARKDGINPFNAKATQYDSWFDSSVGKPIFKRELDCLQKTVDFSKGRWLEVGVGTGRFAERFGISEGVDPSNAVLAYATKRGIKTRVGYGENLPYHDNNFDGILMVVTVCFLADPEAAMKECRRVLKKDGSLVVGLVPKDSVWGRTYMKKGKEGHAFYSYARFYTCNEIISIADMSGFVFEAARSCLFDPPRAELLSDLSVRDGIISGAGFVAMRFDAKQIDKS